MVPLQGLSSVIAFSLALALAAPPPSTVVLRTPGFETAAMVPLLQGLSAAGLPTRLVAVPDHPAASVAEAIASLAEALGAVEGPIILVGHGVGGTLAARAVAAGALPDVQGLVLIGAPLPGPWSEPPPAPLPEALLFGEPLPAILPSAPAWTALLRPQAGEAPLAAWGQPTLAIVGEVDNIGPPEAVRPGLPPGARFLRTGRPRLDGVSHDHGDLLRASEVPRLTARWILRQAAQRPSPTPNPTTP